MCVCVCVCRGMYQFRPRLDAHPRWLARVTTARNVTDAAGLLWFIIGNLWLFDGSNQVGERADRVNICYLGMSTRWFVCCISL